MSANRKSKVAKRNETMRQLVAQLHTRREDVLQMGGERRVQRQHEKGKSDVRQRIAYLFDAGSFVEFGQHAFFTPTGRRFPTRNCARPPTEWSAVGARLTGASWYARPMILRCSAAPSAISTSERSRDVASSRSKIGCRWFG